jgi:hypothetical protein
VVYSTPGTDLHTQHLDRNRAGEPLILAPDHEMAKQAYIAQTQHTVVR